MQDEDGSARLLRALVGAGVTVSLWERQTDRLERLFPGGGAP